MKQHLNKIVSIAAGLSMAVSLFGAVNFANAAPATLVSDTMSREKVSVTSVDHVLTLTIPNGATDGDFVSTYDAGFSAFSFTSASCTGGTVTDNGTATNVLDVSLSGCTSDGSGTMTVNFTGTNPGSAGSKTSVITGTAGITGSYAEPIVTDDQVIIDASVDPSITFNVGSQASATACDGTFAGNGGTVNLGTLVTSAVSSSDASSVPHICTRVSTNASNGAAIAVESANAALKSTSSPSDLIGSATATLTPGLTGYGLCVGSAGGDHGFDTTTPAGNDRTASSPFDGSCTSGAHDVGGLTTSYQPLWTTAGATQNTFARVYVKASIAATVPAHNDYTDTLTFTATGTF